MLNRNPSNTSNVISSYRKRRQQRGPLLVYGAIALVVIGIIIILVWLFGSGQNPIGELFPTDTPTATLTFTPTNTTTPTFTATITETPTITLTPTRSGPTDYIIQEGDTLISIAERFDLGEDGVLLILNANASLTDNFNIVPGQIITIPAPGSTLPTATSLPPNLTRGTRIDYRVLPGDTLAGIAAKFNSILDEIITVNNIENANDLQPGQILKIPVNLVTATATLPPTSTSSPTPTPQGQAPIATATPAASGGNTPVAPSSSATCEYQENPAFVTELQNLINTARTSNGLAALSVNAQLTAAARTHAIDLLCTNTLSHTGSNSSTPQTRVQAQGFTASLVVENLYALSPFYGGNPQSAFTWWNNDPTSKADLLNPNTTVFGVAYVSSEKSLLGGYFVVVSAKP
ncbi:MAG: LysM peptidoglycan-binding domain-containing protein [Chloroflexi bacterium]|nr:LysM peptidoglycan-binding domain-containing protein [Chloroflexota bacterium]